MSDKLAGATWLVHPSGKGWVLFANGIKVGFVQIHKSEYFDAPCVYLPLYVAGTRNSDQEAEELLERLAQEDCERTGVDASCLEWRQDDEWFNTLHLGATINFGQYIGDRVYASKVNRTVPTVFRASPCATPQEAMLRLEQIAIAEGVRPRTTWDNTISEFIRITGSTVYQGA